MKPKEKAVQLFDKMYENQSTSTLSRNVSAFKQAKQCALIAVDEIISLNCINHIDFENNPHHYYSREYWQQVKTEIQNK